MGIFNKLFGKSNEKRKPVAVAFVDYEHWYISMVKLFGEKPDIQGWVKAMNKTYDLKEIIFFADFSNNTLAREINRIREVSSNIVQTANTSQNHKKDFTDFIMLDHIYQRAMSADGIDTFIIFSGDGHFSSVVSYLKNVRKKDVGVCGVKDAFSHQLKNSASWSVEIPDDRLLYGEYYKMILDNLKRIEGSGWKKTSVTFEKTVDAVSTYYQVPAEKISRALISLMNQDYVIEHEEFTGDGKKLLSLEICWSKLLRDGVWQPSESSRRASSSGDRRQVSSPANRAKNSAKNEKTPAVKPAKPEAVKPGKKAKPEKKAGESFASKPEKTSRAEQNARPKKSSVAKKPEALVGNSAPMKITTPTVFEMPEIKPVVSPKKTEEAAVKPEKGKKSPVGKNPGSGKRSASAKTSSASQKKASVQVIYPIRPVFLTGSEEKPPVNAEMPAHPADLFSETIKETPKDVTGEASQENIPVSLNEKTSVAGENGTSPKKKKKRRYYYPKKTANTVKK